MLCFLFVGYFCVASIVAALDNPFILSDNVSKLNGMKLQHIHVLFRHGDRTPIKDIVNSADNSTSLWPAGPGQLTEQGIVQEFELGRWLRQKYGSFIPLAFNASDFHMRSTDIDRTLMSAQSVVAGVYQNASSPLSRYGVLWRPIPVHTVSQEADVLLSIAPCPCLDLLRKLQMNSDEGTTFENRHRELFKLLSDKLNRKIDRFNVWQVSDTLICMRAHNISFPDWCSEKIYEELIDVDTFYWNLQYTKDQDIIRLEIGVFLNTFVDHVTAIVKGLKSPTTRGHNLSVQHTMAYSAHDTDVSYVLSALGAFDAKLVPYSGTVVLELLGPDPPGAVKDYWLRLLYKRGYADSHGEYLDFSSCSNHTKLRGCRLDEFLNNIQPFLLQPDDFNDVCSLGQGHTSRNVRRPHLCVPALPSSYVFVIIGGILLLLLLVLAVLVFLCIRRCNSANPESEHLIPARA